MGHEIVYCFWCSSRILGGDIDKGAAAFIGNHACCSACLPKVLASLPPDQRAALEAPDLPSPRTPRPAWVTLPQPKISPMKIGIVLGALVAVVALLLWLTGDRKEPPAPLPPPKAEKPVADTSTRADVEIDLQAKLREEAAALARRKEAVAQELVRLLDNVDILVRDSDFKKALDILGGARTRHGSPEWASAIDRKIEAVRKKETAGAPPLQGDNPDGIVCVEAEHYDQKRDVGEHAWTLVAAPPGFVGTGAMVALPDKNESFNRNFETLSPRMEYQVRFAKPGKYYMWIRAYGAGNQGDSLHVGLDGKPSGATSMSIGSHTRWVWSNRCAARIAPYLEVPSEGPHTLTVWMREDGAMLDRILLTTNVNYVPKDDGPPESRR